MSLRENEIIAHEIDFITNYKLNGTLTFVQKFFLKIKDENVAEGIKSKVK